MDDIIAVLERLTSGGVSYSDVRVSHFIMHTFACLRRSRGRKNPGDSCRMDAFLFQDLKYREALHCVKSAFILLSGQGESLNIDPQSFYTHLYRTLFHLHAGLCNVCFSNGISVTHSPPSGKLDSIKCCRKSIQIYVIRSCCISQYGYFITL